MTSTPNPFLTGEPTSFDTRDGAAAAFYRACISHATSYCRAVGYFRSSVLNIFYNEMLDFAQRGGSYRVICSVELAREDLEALTGRDQAETVATRCVLSECHQQFQETTGSDSCGRKD